jgi:energy-coupling factor transporter ATP-binding protein EcfA2
MAGVKLKSLEYFHFANGPKKWTLDGLQLGEINLLVGRNATGKTRAINVVWGLSKMLTEGTKFRPNDSNYTVVFDNNGQKIQYVLKIEKRLVIEERVIVDDQEMLVRSTGGGKIIMQGDQGRWSEFRPPADDLAVVNRRDSLQHPFLEPLHTWAEAVRLYRFGEKLGKDHVGVIISGGPEVDDRDADQVLGVFRKGERNLGQPFVNAIVQDMREIGYKIKNVMSHSPEYIKVLNNGIPATPCLLAVHEEEIPDPVDQQDMSQGMFRALSVLIQVNYSQLANRANCILIDDIGEGLDFERSSKLIEILRRKAKASSFQLIMSTNDRLVMNHVPLEEWSVLQREGDRVHVRNYINSKEHFDEFKYIGMSNFSFFEMDFLHTSTIAGEGDSDE